jgi:hypothetical protein
MNNIPTHDPQTGELNPYYEELTGEKNPLSPKENVTHKLKMEKEIHYDYLSGFIDQFGDGPLGELNPDDWDALQFLRWLKLNNYKIIKNGRKVSSQKMD